MNIIPSPLVSDHRNWQIRVEEPSTAPPFERTTLDFLAALVISAVAWPLTFVGGVFLLTISSWDYFKTIWNQHVVINLLANDENLDHYAGLRIQLCETQIENLKKNARFHMEKLKKPEELHLPIPQKKTVIDYLSLELSENYWADFPWNDFMNTDFFEKSVAPHASDKERLQLLESDRVRLKYLIHQKEVLSNPNGLSRLEVIKKVVEMSLIKNAIKWRDSHEWIVHSLFFLLPTGIFWDMSYQLSRRFTYMDDETCLPKIPNFEGYPNLIEAHNQLIAKHDFLIPYIKSRMV